MRTHVICNRFTATVFSLVFCGSGLFAQQRKIDSDDLSDLKKSLYYARQDYLLARKSGDTVLIVTSGNTLAQLYSKMNVSDSARLISEKILSPAKRNNLQKEVGDISETLGLIFLNTSKYDLALQYLFESLTVKEQ